jgi:hypothetical protein
MLIQVMAPFLVGIDLVVRMRETLQLETFPAYVLYEAPSVRLMAQYIEQRQEVVVITARPDHAEKCRAGLTQRLDTRRQRK